MKHNVWVFLIVSFFAVFANAKLIIHVQSPWRDDASKDGYFLHMLGGAGGGYNPQFGETSSTRMTDEGDGWFSYTWQKDVADFQSWESFNIGIYPNTADNNFNNNNGTAWKVAGDMKVADIFGTDVEVWLYTKTDGMTYEKSFVAPGSKMVWFKSPWGNKALPVMIFGKDSILMRFAQDDESKCGWFYGAISPAVMKSNPLGAAHFIRNRTPYMSMPAEGVVELADALGTSDSVFIDGTAGDLTPGFKMGALGECFDSTRTLHIYHPWRTNSTFRDSLIFISIGNNILNNPVATEPEEQFRYWYKYDFDAPTVASSNWASSMATFNIYRRQNEWPQVTFFKEGARPQASQLFPTGVYETWLYTRTSGSYEFLFSPLEPRTVRLLSPWDNMTPTLIVDGDSIPMGSIPRNKLDPSQGDTCGWYQAIVYKHVDEWNVQFKQTIGYEFYSLEGLMGEDGGMGSDIALDSMFALTDMVWVYPYPLSKSGPRFSEKYPERLGICPTMKISAMVVDWAGESYDPSIDPDFGDIYGGNDYTTVTYIDSTGKLATNKVCGGLVKGMVQETLVNGLPARVDSLEYPWGKCSAAKNIESWFVPQVIATDAQGKEYTNAVCRDIDLHMDDEGFWLADITNKNGCDAETDFGFFPIDDLEFLDSAKTIRNPKFDWDVRSNCKHNFSFAMKISAQFKYIKGQYFEFRGDDDVWVFINNRLVVDIGGCHNPEEGFVNLDTIGQSNPSLKLEEGKEYPFHIFFSERNATGSNFKMRTSINLQTQKTFYTEEVPTADGTIQYNLKQLLIDESLSCDVSSVTKVDTSDAQSIFSLVGGSLPTEGVTLEPGLNYGGIWINETMSGFIVDTSAFVNSRQLDPGNYLLICYLASDLSQYEIIFFVVPEYPLPDIAFVDVFNASDSLQLLDPAGLTLRGEPLGLDGGKNDTLLAHVTYPDTVPLEIVLLYGTRPCGNMDANSNVNCSATLKLETDYPIGFLNEDKQRITELNMDSTGYARFYVVGDSAVYDGSFKIYGTGVGNELVWRNINFKEPPVPFAVGASMYDVNGDGIPDSLAIPFSKPFEEVVPDTLKWNFGGAEFKTVAGMERIWSLVLMDSVVSLYDAEGLKSEVFTGLLDKKYSGTLQYHYTYTDKDSGEEVKLEMNTSIEDKVAPIVMSATIETRSEDVSVLSLHLSEGTDVKDLDGNLAFEIYRDSLLFNSSILFASTSMNKQGNLVTIYFQRSATGDLPAVGDYIRLTPGVLTDRSNNAAHVNNPRVRIVGEQRTEIEAPGVVSISSESVWPYKDPVVAISVPTNKTVKDIIDSLGMPGLLVNFDIGELATSLILDLPAGADRDSALALIKIVWEGYYFSHLGSFVNDAHGTVACNDKEIFYNPSDPERSNCFDNPGNIFFEWNARSEQGRLVGTGAYITKMKVKVYSGDNVVGDTEDTYTLGIKRGR
ncbi:MAG: fibro-slime domain-containing protein [Fibrobacter sp.]|nr:fibro-slime domain-containing protein [Fibrobacter sp.]